MKRKILKRLLSIALISVLCMAFATTSFAETITDPAGYVSGFQVYKWVNGTGYREVLTSGANGSNKLPMSVNGSSGQADKSAYFELSKNTPLLKDPVQVSAKGNGALTEGDTDRYRIFPVVSNKGGSSVVTFKSRGIPLAGSKLTMKVKKGGSWNTVVNKGIDWHFMLGLGQYKTSDSVTYSYTGGTSNQTAYHTAIKWIDVTSQVNKAPVNSVLGEGNFYKISVDIDDILASENIKNVQCTEKGNLTTLDADSINAVVFGVTGVPATTSEGQFLLFSDISIEYPDPVQFAENSSGGVTMTVDTSRLTALTVVTAYYNGTELADVKVNDISAAEATTDLPISSTKTYDKVKVFAVNNLTDITPLTDAITINK